MASVAGGLPLPMRTVRGLCDLRLGMWLRTDGDGCRRGSHRQQLAAGRGARKLVRRRETLSGEGSGKGSCHMSPRRQHLSRISVAGALRCEAPTSRGHTVLSRDEVLSGNGDDCSRRRDACDAGRFVASARSAVCPEQILHRDPVKRSRGGPLSADPCVVCFT